MNFPPFRFSALLVALHLAAAASAQVSITEQPSVAELMAHFEQRNRSTEFMEGWRVQILATTDRAKMEAARTSFLRLFPNMSAEWSYDDPYFTLKVGAFKRKIDTAKLLLLLKTDYPGAYPAKDREVRPAEFLGY